MSVGRVVFGESVVCGSGTVGLFEGLDDKLVVVHMGPADLRGRFEAAGGEQLFGPVHEAVRLGLEVEGDVVRGAEGGLFVTHHTEVEASTIVQPTAEAEVARHPVSNVLVARDNLVWALKARRHSQSGSGCGGAVPGHVAVSSRTHRSDTELAAARTISATPPPSRARRAVPALVAVGLAHHGPSSVQIRASPTAALSSTTAPAPLQIAAAPTVLQQSLKVLRPAGARRPHLVRPPLLRRRPRETLGRHPPHDRLTPPMLLLRHRLRMRSGGGGLLQRGAQQVREGVGGGRGRGV